MSLNTPRRRLPGRRPLLGGDIVNARVGQTTPRDIVGLAHVIVGAFGVLTGTFGAMFAVDRAAPAILALNGAVVVTALLTILAGLWLRDGRHRGAVLAVVLDGLRLLVLVWAMRDLTVDVILAAGLLGAVVWLWPTLGDEDGPSPDRV